MAVLLIALLLLVPLGATDGFSDFDVLKIALGATLGAIGWGLAARTTWRRGARGGLAFVASAAAILIAFVLSWITTLRLGLPLIETVRDLTFLGTGVVIAFAAAQADLSERQRVAVLHVGAFVPAAVLLAQLVLDLDVNPLGVPHLTGLYTATLGNTAFVGEVAAISLAFTLILWVSGRRSAAVASALPALFLLYRADSRGAWLGAVTLVAVFAWFGRPKGARAAAPARGPGGMVLLAVAGVLVGSAVTLERGIRPDPVTRAASIFDRAHDTNRVRFQVWKDAGRMIRDHAVLGVGGGNFGLVHPAYRGEEEWALSGIHTSVPEPHDEPLRFLAEYGLAGTAAFGAALFLLVRSLLRRRRDDDGAPRPEAAAALAVLAGLFVSSLFWAVLQHPATVTAAAVVVGLGLGAGPRDTVTTIPRRLTVLLTGLVAVPAALFALLWLERDSACVSLRDRSEELKRSIMIETESGPFPVIAATDLGRVGKAILESASSPLIRTALRHRLLDAAYNLAEQQRLIVSSANAFRPENDDQEAGRNLILNAARTWPTTADLREALGEAHGRAPNHFPTLRLLAALERFDGRTVEAREWLEKALERNPSAPLVRLRLAELFGDADLYARAVEALKEEIALYPDAEHSDAAWELLARSQGFLGRLREGVATVGEWADARGDTPARWAVAGELALHYGETPDTVGDFVASPEKMAERAERGAYVRASLSGVPPAERRTKLLAHLGRHAHDAAVLEDLRDALGELTEGARGASTAYYRNERRRVISRTRVLYAFEHRLAGDRNNLYRCTRIARRTNPRQGDAYYLDILSLVEQDRLQEALMSLRAWREQGFDTFPALEANAALDGFTGRPDVQEILDP